MSKPTTVYVGLDTHKNSIAVAHAKEDSRDAPVYVGPIGSREADVDKLVRRLQSTGDRLAFASEAPYVPVRYPSGTDVAAWRSTQRLMGNAMRPRGARALL